MTKGAHFSKGRLHTTMIDPQTQFFRTGELAFVIQVCVKLSIAQRGLERLDIFPI